MGHLHCYLLASEQPQLFQDTHAVIQESIGDAIFMGMMTPQHLNRLHLLSDSLLFSLNQPTDNDRAVFESILSINLTDISKHSAERDSVVTVNGVPFPKISEINKMTNEHNKALVLPYQFDVSHLLEMALWKIPQIPFQFIMDVWRWRLFNGSSTMSSANKDFWEMAMREQGIHPPENENRWNMFDPGAKFHVSDNTPYSR